MVLDLFFTVQVQQDAITRVLHVFGVNGTFPYITGLGNGL